MTEEITTPAANKVIVVGMLDTMLVRDRNAKKDKEPGRPKMVEITHKTGRRSGKGGRWENLKLQVRSPYGGMFALPIEIEPDVEGAELLDSAEAETMLAVEGSLQLKQTFDGRFASDRLDFRGRSDRGHPTRELQLLVSCVRAATAQERRSSSAVWLEGVVAEPPQVSRHPDLPAVQLGGTILTVTFARSLEFPGIEATIDEAVEVNVAIATSHKDAEKLFRQGNTVRLIGQLDCRMEFQGGAAVNAKLAVIDAEWAARKEELAGKPSELRQAERSYRNLRMRFEAAARMYVLAGHVELLHGEPVALADTYEVRRAFVRAQRTQRDERRARAALAQARRATSTAGSDAHKPDTAERIEDMPVIATVKDVGMDPAAGTTRAARPRRLVKEPLDAGAPELVSGMDEAVTVTGNGAGHTDAV